MKSISLFVLLLFGCGGLATGAADRGSLVSATLVEACPLGVPWTRLDKRVTDRGIDVIFTSVEPSRVPELRERVRDQAHAYGPHRHAGPGHEGTHEGPRDHGLRLWSMGDIVTEVDDTAAGATIAIAPVDPARRDELRKLVAERVNELASSGCQK